MPPKACFLSFRSAPPVSAITLLLILIGLGVPVSLAQMRSVRVSSGQVRVAPALGSRRPPFPSQGFRPTTIRSFGHRAFVRRFPFRHHGMHVSMIHLSTPYSANGSSSTIPFFSVSPFCWLIPSTQNRRMHRLRNPHQSKRTSRAN